MRKVLVLGATGTVGLPLCKKLASLGLKVVGTGATGRNFEALAEVAKPVKMNVLNSEEVNDVIKNEGGDVVINCMSKLPNWIRCWKPERDFVENNAIRLHGSTHLLNSLKKHNPDSFLISTSHANCGAPLNFYNLDTGVNFESGAEVMKSIGVDDVGGKYSDEKWQTLTREMPTTSLTITADEFPFGDHTIPLLASFNQALFRMERLTRTHTKSCVLRLGLLYGPGTTFAEGGEFYKKTKAGKLRIVQPARGVWSLLHVNDAVDAVVAVVMSSSVQKGNYNVIAEADGVTVSEWFTRYSNHVGAPQPSSLSLLLARFCSPHMMFLCNGQRPADPGNFPTAYSWTPTQPPIWEA